MSFRPSAHPGLVWRWYGAASVLVVVASLVATVPSGDRLTIVLTLWCDLVAIVVAAAVTNAVVTPSPGRDGSEPFGSPGHGGGYLDSKGSKYRGTWL